MRNGNTLIFTNRRKYLVSPCNRDWLILRASFPGQPSLPQFSSIRFLEKYLAYHSHTKPGQIHCFQRSSVRSDKEALTRILLRLRKSPTHHHECPHVPPLAHTMTKAGQTTRPRSLQLAIAHMRSCWTQASGKYLKFVKTFMLVSGNLGLNWKTNPIPPLHEQFCILQHQNLRRFCTALPANPRGLTSELSRSPVVTCE